MVFIGAVIFLMTPFLSMSDDTCPSGKSPLDFSCDCQPSPINILTNNLQQVSLPSLNIVNAENTDTILINTYVTIEARINQSSSAGVTGGPLANKGYTFYKDRFYWIDCDDQIAAGAIDNIGTKLTIASYYYNRDYGSFNEARYRPDGITILITPVNVTGSENPNFSYFQGKLQSVTQPGASVGMKQGPYYKWFIQPNYFDKYYIYRGKYYNEGTGDGETFSSCATVIVFAKSVEITFTQYLDSFLRAKTVINTTLEYNLPIYGLGNRPVFVASGVNATNVQN